MHIQNHLHWWTKCAKTKFKLYKHVHQLLCKISLFRVSWMEKSETTTTAPCLDDFPLSNNNVTTKSSQWMKSSQICPNHTLHIPCLTNSCNSHLFSIGKQLVLNAQHTPVIPNSDTKCRHYIFIQTPTCLKSLEWLLVLGYNNLNHCPCMPWGWCRWGSMVRNRRGGHRTCVMKNFHVAEAVTSSNHCPRMSQVGEGGLSFLPSTLSMWFLSWSQIALYKWTLAYS